VDSRIIHVKDKRLSGIEHLWARPNNRAVRISR
jgi:hypothetical protein